MINHSLGTYQTENLSISLRGLCHEDSRIYFETIQPHLPSLGKADHCLADAYGDFDTFQHSLGLAGKDHHSPMGSTYSHPNMELFGIWWKDQVLLGGVECTAKMESYHDHWGPIFSTHEAKVWLDSSARGNGFATVALRALNKHMMFEYEYQQVNAKIDMDNIEAMKVFSAAGYTMVNSMEDQYLFSAFNVGHENFVTG